MPAGRSTEDLQSERKSNHVGGLHFITRKHAFQIRAPSKMIDFYISMYFVCVR